MANNRNTDEPTSKAEVIRERDRYRCQNCFQQWGEVNELHIHRIVPEEHGGTDRISNFTTLCDVCHQGAHEGESGGETVR